MDFRKQIKDFNVDYSARCRQLEELRTECSASEMGVSVLSSDLSVSRDYLKTRRNTMTALRGQSTWRVFIIHVF